jgi:hypothetical protein
MRIRALLCATALLVAGSASAATDGLPDCPAADGVKLAAGDYLETGYIETLHKSLSPLAAMGEGLQTGAPQRVAVSLKGDGLQLVAGFNWHEGGWLFTLHSDGRLERDRNWGGVDTASFQVIDRCAFRLAAPNAPVRIYRYIGSDTGYVARIVLAGSYADAQGRSYRFDADGNAVFPGRTFRYTVELDQVLDPYDFVHVGDTKEYIAFHRDGDTLALYPVVANPDSGGFGSPDLGHPIATLRRTTAH